MRQRKKKRKQIYTELWGTDADELRRMLNIIGVDAVALQFGCSRFTVWRAGRGKGLRRGKDGKYVHQPPHPENPDEADAFRKMVESSPWRGPSIVVIDAQVGRGRTRALSLWCDHEWEMLVYESPIPSLSRSVTRCKWCLRTKS